MSKSLVAPLLLTMVSQEVGWGSHCKPFQMERLRQTRGVLSISAVLWRTKAEDVPSEEGLQIMRAGGGFVSMNGYK